MLFSLHILSFFFNTLNTYTSMAVLLNSRPNKGNRKLHVVRSIDITSQLFFHCMDHIFEILLELLPYFLSNICIKYGIHIIRDFYHTVSERSNWGQCFTIFSDIHPISSNALECIHLLYYWADPLYRKNAKYITVIK